VVGVFWCFFSFLGFGLFFLCLGGCVVCLMWGYVWVWFFLGLWFFCLVIVFFGGFVKSFYLCCWEVLVDRMFWEGLVVWVCLLLFLLV